MAQINKPSEYFNTVLYTGDGTTSNAITGVGFQPDLVWLKNRSAESSQLFQDSVRGKSGSNYLYLQGNDTAAEAAQGDGDGLNTIGADGFTVGYTNSAGWNTSGNNYVSWNWLADNTSGSSNTDGSITSTVSANTTSGFSIVSYTGTGSAATVGHGLNAVPKMIITKRRNGGDSWSIYHAGIASDAETDVIYFETGAAFDNATFWNDTAPTSSVFSVGSASSANPFIAYCFAEKKGFSKFGSYTGNGSTDGPFIYTGFKPAMVIAKRTNSTGNWRIRDNKRSPNNVITDVLYPNSSSATITEDNHDFLSNGFKVRTTGPENNASGGTFIYMAFAENPLVGTNNIPTTAR
jgi:hypothetical protein